MQGLETELFVLKRFELAEFDCMIRLPMIPAYPLTAIILTVLVYRRTSLDRRQWAIRTIHSYGDYGGMSVNTARSLFTLYKTV